MGAVSEALASSAREAGVQILTHCDVEEIMLEQDAGETVVDGLSATSPPPSLMDYLPANPVRKLFGMNKTPKEPQQRAVGVRLLDGTEIRAKRVISGCTPYQTFLEMMPFEKKAGTSINDFSQHVRWQDNGCGAFKVNCALRELPDFLCLRNEICLKTGRAKVGPQHRGTIHFEERMQEIEDA